MPRKAEAWTTSNAALTTRASTPLATFTASYICRRTKTMTSRFYHRSSLRRCVLQPEPAQLTQWSPTCFPSHRQQKTRQLRLPRTILKRPSSRAIPDHSAVRAVAAMEYQPQGEEGHRQQLSGLVVLLSKSTVCTAVDRRLFLAQEDRTQHPQPAAT